MKFVVAIIISYASFVTPAYSQEVNQNVQAGNDAYRKKEFEKAEQEYNKALKTEASNITAQLNLTNTVYRLGRADEAVKKFDELAKSQKESATRARAYYNKGAILSQQRKLEQSIEAYKNTLRLDPNDKEARENLQKALLEQKRNQPPPEKKNDQQKKQQQQKQQEQQRPKMNQQEAEQRLKLLEQKEKEVQQRLQKEKSRNGGSQAKDW